VQRDGRGGRREREITPLERWGKLEIEVHTGSKPPSPPWYRSTEESLESEEERNVRKKGGEKLLSGKPEGRQGTIQEKRKRKTNFELTHA